MISLSRVRPFVKFKSRATIFLSLSRVRPYIKFK